MNDRGDLVAEFALGPGVSLRPAPSARVLITPLLAVEVDDGRGTAEGCALELLIGDGWNF